MIQSSINRMSFAVGRGETTQLGTLYAKSARFYSKHDGSDEKDAVDSATAKAKGAANSAMQSAKHVVEGAEEFLEKARKRSGEFIHDEAQMIRHKLSDAAASLRDKTSGFTDSADPTARTIREIKKKSREHGGHSDEMDHSEAEMRTKYK